MSDMKTTREKRTRRREILFLTILFVPVFYGFSLMNPEVSMAQSQLCLTVNDVDEFASLGEGTAVIDTQNSQVVATNSFGQTKTFSYKESNGLLCFSNADIGTFFLLK